MTTYSSQPDETTGLDAWIYSQGAVTNYNDTQLFIGQEVPSPFGVGRGLIAFNFSSITPGSACLSATLSLYVIGDYADSSGTISLYRVLRNWVETEVTWNNYSSGNAWTTAGCGSAGNDYNSTALATGSTGSAESNGTEIQLSFNASGLLVLNQMINSEISNYGFLLRYNTEAWDGYSFASSGYATSGYRPKLDISYVTPGGQGPMIIGLFEKMKRRTQLYRELLRKGAIPLGNRELMPI